MRIAIASDHAGFYLKELLLNRLAAEPDLTLVDLGTNSAAPPVDYPDYAQAAAEAVVRGDVDRSIMVCGSGAGACIAADKIPGARAFFAGDTYTAHQAVEHDDGNVLCLGERVTGPELAIEIARAYIRAQFSDQERHRRRVGKIAAIEAESNFPVEAVVRHGQSIWMDTISRSMVTSGELRRLAWQDRVVGVTSNPTIFEKAMGHEPEYEAPARELAEQGKSAEDIYWTLAIEDIQGATDILRATYQLTDGGDGYVSLECAPAIANARLAYARFNEIFSGSAWNKLAEQGADVQRPLWASTSTKNPRYRDVRYVEELVGPNTVNTMPPQTLEALKDHGWITRTVDTPEALERARKTMQQLKEAGIDMDAVTLQLQHEGVKSFADSYDQLIATLEQRRKALARA